MQPTRIARGIAVAVAILLVVPTVAVGHDHRASTRAAPELGPEVAPAVAGIDFGEVQVGTTSAAEDYVYTNSTAGDVTVTVAVVGANPGDFDIAVDTCTGAPIPAAGTCTISVTFTPTAEYSRSAVLDVTDSQPSQEAIPLSGVGVLPEPAVTWGSTRVIGSAYTWTQGTALARSVSGSTQYLHAAVLRYDVSTQGIYYRRSTNAATWKIGKRLNPSTQHAGRATIAAKGKYVYVAWSSYAKANPKGTQPRVLYFRANANYGSGPWRSIRRLTSTSGRIDFPRIAVAGRTVYVTYTDSATGKIKAKISRDRGKTWRTISLGRTTRYDSWGRYGLPVVAASGSTVGIAWISNASGKIRFRWSSNHGSTWKSAITLGSGAEAQSWPSIAALGTRIAVSWVGNSAMVVRVRTGTSWGPSRSVRPSAGSAHDYEWPWNGQVVLNGTSRVALAWEECWAGCAASDPDTAFRGDLLWRESADNGASWARSQVVGEADDYYTDYYFPSVIWPAATTRYVMAARWVGMMLLDNVAFRVGTGAP